MRIDGFTRINEICEIRVPLMDPRDPRPVNIRDPRPDDPRSAYKESELRVRGRLEDMA